MNDESENNAEPSPGGSERSIGIWAAGTVIVIVLAVLMTRPDWVKGMVKALSGHRYRAPSKHSCISNLKQIDGGVQEWALENRKVATDTYTFADTNLMKYYRGSTLPICPAGGTYSPGKNVASAPRCIVPNHTL